MAHKISDDVAEVLRSATCSSDRLTLVGQLDRKMYEKVNKVLDISGFKWSRKDKCHLAIKGTATETLAAALNDGEIVDPKKEWDFFETPEYLANRMVNLLQIHKDGVVDSDLDFLEPSVGGGRLYDALLRAGVEKFNIWVCEIQEDLAKKWDDPEIDDIRQFNGPWFLGRDFLAVDPKESDGFHRIIANFPFSKFSDIAHCRHAYSLLNDGGRMVCITSPSWQFRTDKKSVEFKTWFESLPSVTVEELPAGTFRDSGTNVRALLLAIDKEDA